MVSPEPIVAAPNGDVDPLDGFDEVGGMFSINSAPNDEVGLNGLIALPPNPVT